MKVRVKLFAVAKELVGRDVLEIEVPAGATVADVRDALGHAHPALSRVLPHAMWAIDASYAIETTPLSETSDVALIPPVSGG
jgi:molybdopterin converting factor subunit 1